MYLPPPGLEFFRELRHYLIVPSVTLSVAAEHEIRENTTRSVRDAYESRYTCPGENLAHLSSGLVSGQF